MYVKFELDKPELIALKYPSPQIVADRFKPGENQCAWMLLDGRRMYTPLSVGSDIEKLGVKVGQRFQITKRKAGRGIAFSVELAKSNGQPAAALLDSSASLDSVVEEIPQATLEGALKVAVCAAAAAEKHGQAIGYTIRFQPQDIRCMAISVLIGMQQNRRAA